MTDRRSGHTALEVVRPLLGGHERFAVTGASGWFGRTALDLLARALGPDAFTGRVQAYASTAKPVELRDGAVVVAEPLGNLLEQPERATHLLHFAYLTRDRVAELGAEAYAAANRALTDIVLEAVRRGGLAGLAYVSSGASTQAADTPYGALKQADEEAFRKACAAAGTSCCIARVFATSGPYMTKPHLYALGEFVQQALRGLPIEIRAERPVFRSYTGVEDIVTLLFAAVLGPTPTDTVFETGGEVVEVEGLARRVTRVLGRADLPVVRDTEPSGPEDRYVGDPTAMQELADRVGLGLASLDEQIEATAEWLAAQG